VVRHADEQIHANIELPHTFGQLLETTPMVRIISKQSLLGWPACPAVASQRRRLAHHPACDMVDRPHPKRSARCAAPVERCSAPFMWQDAGANMRELKHFVPFSRNNCLWPASLNGAEHPSTGSSPRLPLFGWGLDSPRELNSQMPCHARNMTSSTEVRYQGLTPNAQQKRGGGSPIAFASI
jgi:hypothetical protein